MSLSIWKFGLALADLQGVSMPSGAEILHAGCQGDNVCIWAQVDTEADTVIRTFSVIGTGHIAPADGVHVGSALMRDGTFVWHVYEHPSRAENGHPGAET